MPQEKFYITITGMRFHAENVPFEIGRSVLLRKEPENLFDAEAIVVWTPGVGVIGYVANSAATVARGTMSAGRLYDKIGEYGAAKVLFMFKNAIIAEMTDFQLQRGQKSESAILQWEAERSGGA